MSSSSPTTTNTKATTAAATTTTTSSPAAASSSSSSSSQGGRLYVCGRVGGKSGRGLCALFPISDKYIDNHGHCSYPKPLRVADSSVRFSHVKGEHLGMTAALEKSPNPGGLWCCNQNSKEVYNAIPKGVVSFAVAASYALAAMQDGSLMIIGSHHHIDPSNDSGDPMPRPFKVKPPKGVTSVAASEEAIAIVCGDAGEVWTIGPSEVANGHGKSLTEEWKRIELKASNIISAPSEPALAAAASSKDEEQDKKKQETTTSNANFKAVFVAQGSLTGGCVTACGKVFLWGDGLSGTLGTGERTKHNSYGEAIGHDFAKQFNDPAVHVALTTSQPNPKRTSTKERNGIGGGQEGGRTHVVTKSGALYICGTTHKGLGANCMYKTLGQDDDLLSFYKVGGHAMDWKSRTKCPTGGAEDLARRDGAPPEVVAERLGMESADLFGKNHDTNYLTQPGLKIISSQPTHIHSVAVSADGRCFAWGCGSDGRTGLRAFLRGPSGSKRLMKCYVSSPSAIEELQDKKVLDACACRNYTLFVAE